MHPMAVSSPIPRAPPVIGMTFPSSCGEDVVSAFSNHFLHAILLTRKRFMTQVVSSCSARRRAIADGMCSREGASKSLTVDEARVMERTGWGSRIDASRPGWRRMRPETANRVRESMLNIACLVYSVNVYVLKDRTSVVGVRKSEGAIMVFVGWKNSRRVQILFDTVCTLPVRLMILHHSLT